MSASLISEAERKYKTILEEFCQSLFHSAGIPSHDHLHHARVWYYAKEILEQLFEARMITDTMVAEKAIVAAYFHDTGLTLNTGPDHGRESRNICSKYLQDNNLFADTWEEILNAVERHDDKSYSSASDPASLAAIISVADDMDAFGYTGILRYSEIYSMRGVPMEEMPDKIITNAKSRFNHLESTYRIFPALVVKQAERLEILISFYQSLKIEMSGTGKH
jgi:HD superfamily phosphodiesterase